MNDLSGVENHENPSPTVAPVRWSFLTKHAQMLVCIAEDPGARLRDLAERVGITERATHSIVSDLANAGYINRERVGRRSKYSVNAEIALPDPVLREQKVGELLGLLVSGRAHA